MQNIYLTGMPGCGKSALGRACATLLNRDFIDTDELALNLSREADINSIFAKQGVDAFRKMERRILTDLSQKQRLIVSTGGGVILDRANVDAMLNSGFILFIDVSLDTLKKRIDTSGRPLVADIGPALEHLYFNRYERYKNNCTHVFSNEFCLNEAVKQLVSFINGL